MKYTGKWWIFVSHCKLGSPYLSEEEVRMQSLPEFRLVEDAVKKIDAEIEIYVKIETE
jgi:hypothetical protein